MILFAFFVFPASAVLGTNALAAAGVGVEPLLLELVRVAAGPRCWLPSGEHARYQPHGGSAKDHALRMPGNSRIGAGMRPRERGDLSRRVRHRVYGCRRPVAHVAGGGVHVLAYAALETADAARQGVALAFDFV